MSGWCCGLYQIEGERKSLSVRPELVEGQLSSNLKYAPVPRPMKIVPHPQIWHFSSCRLLP
jgi:hypothetical protein